MTPRPSRRTTATEELAVLADGPWLSRWYWRADLERMQESARRFPEGDPAGQHQSYRPTNEWRDNPEGFGSGRVWRYRPTTGQP